MKNVTIDELLSRWWNTHYKTKEELSQLDLDELLTRIGIAVLDYEDKVPIISDLDEKTYGTDTVWVSFDLETQPKRGD